jgi:polysaccharide export outer membrane protein
MIKRICILTLFAGYWAAPAGAAETVPYLLNPGDVLTISVWKEEGLDREVVVLPDGTIGFPLAGHLQAAGETPEAVQQAVTERLQPYIPDAVVTVAVKQASGNFVYVLGQVRQPGAFPVGGMIDVMQALSLAGGLTPFASRHRIVILRRDGDKQISLPFDYADVEDGDALDSNVELRSGDVVVVPE